MNADAYQASAALSQELQGPNVLERVAREYLEIRDQENAAKSRRDAVRKVLLPLLEDAGGSYIDEVAGVRIYIEKGSRWEYDPTKLHRLVDDGLVSEKEFGDCLRTIVDKAVVEGWLKRGLTERQLARADAKKMTRIVPTIKVEDIARRRR